MDLQKTLKRINEGRNKAEAGFVFGCWQHPEYYDTYGYIHKNLNKTLHNQDARFYWTLGYTMYHQGIKRIDEISVDTFLSGKEKALQKFEEYGGFRTVKELMGLVSSDNAEAYFDILSRMNSLETWAIKTDELMNDLDRFNWATSNDIYEAFQDINNSIAINTTYEERFESLSIEDEFIDGLNEGEEMGFNYGRYCPILNWITLGAMPGSLYMIAGHSGKGKTSFSFENILMGLHYQKDTGDIIIISNEMKIKAYKLLLLNHILTKDMKYYKLTRKQLQKGGFTEEQKAKLREAAQISREQYSDIRFLKLFNNDINKIMKYIEKAHSENVRICLIDTLKADDDTRNKAMWESLLQDSRKIFQLCSKLDMVCFTTYQLSLSTLNVRYLDSTCLSNSKQIKEVYESLILVRPVWTDEYKGQKHDIHPWRWQKDENNQYVTDENGKRVTEEIALDPDEKYFLVFIDKTRADEDQQVILYRWRSRFNDFRELGYAKVENMHIYT